MDQCPEARDEVSNPSISLSPLTTSVVSHNPYPAPLNSGRIGDIFCLSLLVVWWFASNSVFGSQPCAGHGTFLSSAKLRGSGCGVRGGLAADAANEYMGLCKGRFIGVNCQIRWSESDAVFGSQPCAGHGTKETSSRFRGDRGSRGDRGGVAASAATIFLWGCAQAGKTDFGLRIGDCGKVSALMRRKFLWGMYTGECEKPVQVETLRLPRFGELAAERTEGSYDGSHRNRLRMVHV
jgi:hypothetical protein